MGMIWTSLSLWTSLDFAPIAKNRPSLDKAII